MATEKNASERHQMHHEIAEAKFKKFDSVKSTAHGAMGFWVGDINKIYVLRRTN